MANYEKRSCVNGKIAYGPEDTNGTGQVFFDADECPRWLSQEDVAVLILALSKASRDAQEFAKRINHEE